MNKENSLLIHSIHYQGEIYDMHSLKHVIASVSEAISKLDCRVVHLQIGFPRNDIGFIG